MTVSFKFLVRPGCGCATPHADLHSSGGSQACLSRHSWSDLRAPRAILRLLLTDRGGTWSSAKSKTFKFAELLFTAG